MNDIFYFIDLCDLANYTDDNTLSIIASTIVVLVALKQDTENAILWSINKIMQVNTSNFECMFKNKSIIKQRSYAEVHKNKWHQYSM